MALAGLEADQDLLQIFPCYSFGQLKSWTVNRLDDTSLLCLAPGPERLGLE
jgi:hypothetical protein